MPTKASASVVAAGAIVITVFDVQETVLRLRQLLGPIYDWNNRLADMRRGRVSKGPLLLPVAKRFHAGYWRPVYAAQSIAEFVEAYREHDPATVANVPAIPVLLATFPGDRRSWRTRHLPEAIGN